MPRLVLMLALSLVLVACGSIHERTNMPRPPFCVRDGNVPVVSSMDDYGATYTPRMQRGPVPAAPDSRLIPESEAGADCVAPPWWEYPEADNARDTPRETYR